MDEITATLEDYIESIFMLSGDDGVSIKSIAKKLNIKKSSVVASIRRLKEKELVEQKHYGKVKLTEKGKEKAGEIYNKHNLIKQFFLRIGVDAEKAEKEACLIEHFLSDDTVNKMMKYVK